MKKIITDFNLLGKKVIIRCDLNVPIENGVILDDNRIKESLSTIKYALGNSAKVILLSHLGRIKTEEDKLINDLKPVANRLSELLNKKVMFVNETRGSVLENSINNMKNGDVILIQNTRYEDFPDNKESSNDEELGKYWASLGEIFINDAFGTAHRAHASNVGIAEYLPSGIGFLVKKELDMLGNLLDNPKRPYVVVMGGAKMKDKIKVMDKLIEKADYILLGGGIANTFLVAKKIDVKKSVYDEESVEHAKMLISKYKDKIILPLDGYGSFEYKDGLEVYYSDINSVKDGVMVLDLGPKTLKLYEKYLSEAKNVFWNGPIGVNYFKNFEYGTKTLCEILKHSNAEVIVGGGDSAAAVISLGYKDSFAHISTGGGASLEFIEGKVLPGVDAIDNN